MLSVVVVVVDDLNLEKGRGTGRWASGNGLKAVQSIACFECCVALVFVRGERTMSSSRGFCAPVALLWSAGHTIRLFQSAGGTAQQRCTSRRMQSSILQQRGGSEYEARNEAHTEILHSPTRTTLSSRPLSLSFAGHTSSRNTTWDASSPTWSKSQGIWRCGAGWRKGFEARRRL